MTMQRHDEIRELLDEYALGQLQSEACRRVEAHVRDCDECAGELRELALVVEGLARAVEPVAVPPALRQRVLNRVAQESQIGVIAPRADRRFAPGPWLAAAAAVVVVLGSLLFLAVDRARRADRDWRVARSEASALPERLDDYAGQTDLALSILTAGDMRRLELSGSQAWSGSAARAYWSPTRGLLVVADQLPVPPPGRIYQVWVIAGAKPISAGLLGSPQTGRGMLIAPPPGGAALGTVTVAVTDEPPGGLPAPSGTIRLAGSL